MTRSQDPLEELVDALIYAPIGIVLDIVERYPEHVSRGRRQVEVFEKLGGAVLRGFGFTSPQTRSDETPAESASQQADAANEIFDAEIIDDALDETLEKEAVIEAEEILLEEEAVIEAEEILLEEEAVIEAEEILLEEEAVAATVASEAAVVDQIAHRSSDAADQDLEAILDGTVGEVSDALTTLSAPLVEELIRLEEAGKDRVTVLRAARKRLDDIRDAD